jgi:DNA-binding NarL/FixJ family response regulator
MKIEKFDGPSDAQRILLVGSPAVFSDTLLAIAGAVFHDFTLERVGSIKTLRRSLADPPAIRDDVAMVIVVEDLLDSLCRHHPTLSEQFPQACFVLGYRDLRKARQLFSAALADPPLARIGYLPMDLQVDRWIALCRLLLSGQLYVPSELFTEVPVERFDPPSPARQNRAAANAGGGRVAPADGIDALTAREVQVLHLVSQGKQNKIIAEELKLSQHTVKLHIHHVIEKLGVHNRTEAAVRYLARTEAQRETAQ